MHDNPTPEPADAFGGMDRDMLYLLTDGDEPIWSVDDLGRALDCPRDAADCIGELRRAGLIHQTSDGFVFATRAAFCMVQMVGQVV